MPPTAKNSRRTGRPREIEGDETERITALTSVAAKKRLGEIARAHGWSMSACMRRMIDEFLAKYSSVAAAPGEPVAAMSASVVILDRAIRRKPRKKSTSGGKPRNSRAGSR